MLLAQGVGQRKMKLFLWDLGVESLQTSVTDVRCGVREAHAKSDIQISVLSINVSSQTPHVPNEDTLHPLFSTGPSSVTGPRAICLFYLLEYFLFIYFFFF